VLVPSVAVNRSTSHQSLSHHWWETRLEKNALFYEVTRVLFITTTNRIEAYNIDSDSAFKHVVRTLPLNILTTRRLEPYTCLLPCTHTPTHCVEFHAHSHTQTAEREVFRNIQAKTARAARPACEHRSGCDAPSPHRHPPHGTDHIHTTNI